MSQLANMLSEYGLYVGIPLTFLAVVAWIYRPSAKKGYQKDGDIPFYGDKKDDKTQRGNH
jgi:cbb3-type cytochrome oxidase subunit 3